MKSCKNTNIASYSLKAYQPLLRENIEHFVRLGLLKCRAQALALTFESPVIKQWSNEVESRQLKLLGFSKMTLELYL